MCVDTPGSLDFGAFTLALPLNEGGGGRKQASTTMLSPGAWKGEGPEFCRENLK